MVRCRLPRSREDPASRPSSGSPRLTDLRSVDRVDRRVISQGRNRIPRLFSSRPFRNGGFLNRLLLVGMLASEGLCACRIRAIDSSQFQRAFSLLAVTRNEGLLTEKGCIVSHESLMVVLNRIEAGEYSKGASNRRSACLPVADPSPRVACSILRSECRKPFPILISVAAEDAGKRLDQFLADPA